MAIKGEKAKPAQAAGVATETAPVTTPDAGSGDGGETKVKRTRKPGFDWTFQRQQALANVLKTEAPAGTIRTAGSVAQALADLPEFEGAAPGPQDVAACVKAAQKRYQKAHELGERTDDGPSWLKLDSARRNQVFLEAFEE